MLTDNSIKIKLTSAALAALMILTRTGARAPLHVMAEEQPAAAEEQTAEIQPSIAETQTAPAQPAIDKPAAGAELPHAASFSVTIPPEFKPTDKEGVFVARRYPLDSANITVSLVDLKEEAALTNNEKAAMSERGETKSSLIRLYTSLTKDKWLEAAQGMLDEGLEISLKTFEKTSIRRPSDGTSFPGYRIVAEITGAKKGITEDVRMFISDDKVFTVTYARASDDEFEDIFAESLRSITVY